MTKKKMTMINIIALFIGIRMMLLMKMVITTAR